MEALLKSRILHIQRPEVVRLLVNSNEQPFLLPYMKAEHSVAEVARKLNLDFQLVYRKTKRLERYGLIKQTRTKTRTGRPVAFYRAVADRFFASAKVMSLEQIFDLLESNLIPKMRKGLMNEYYNAPDQNVGTHFFANEKNHLSVLFGHADPNQTWRPRTPTMSFWRYLYLNHETAQQLRQDLEQILSRYDQPSGKDPYLLHLEMAPRLDE
jgi:predicted transcriptional regulator